MSIKKEIFSISINHFNKSKGYFHLLIEIEDCLIRL